jgi:hypothetical protein
MTRTRYTPRPAPIPAIVRRIMRKHGLTEPSARAVAGLAYGEVAIYGG